MQDDNGILFKTLKKRELGILDSVKLKQEHSPWIFPNEPSRELTSNNQNDQRNSIIKMVKYS